MLKRMLLCSGLMLVMVSLSFGQSITGSDHDFSGAGWNSSSGEICIVCHTPHNARAAVEQLWNHDITAASHTTYSSVTLDATVGVVDGTSKLCLSCHDGTIAIDAFGSNSGTTFISGGANVGTDLSNDHPVSFTYDAALASTDGELADPTNITSGLGGTIDADMLKGGKLQCSSCHDPHDASNSKFLVKSNAVSALCLTCHIK